MFKIQKPKLTLCQKAAAWKRRNAVSHDVFAARMALVTSALHYREAAGQTTSLRQVHKIAGLSQPEALNIIAQLESAGVVSLEDNISDTFESLIHLNDEVQDRFGARIRSDAA